MSQLAEQLIRHARLEKDIKMKGIMINVFRNVFPPIHPDSELLAECNDTKVGERVLDMGTGTGLQAIVSGFRGAEKVVAIDILKDAVKNALYNVNKHNLSKIIEVRLGDLFNPIKSKEKFDIILVNLPFENQAIKKQFDSWVYDYNYKLHKRFLKECSKYLTGNGRVLLVFSSIGDLRFLKNEIRKNGLKFVILKEKIKFGYRWLVYKLWR